MSQEKLQTDYAKEVYYGICASTEFRLERLLSKKILKLKISYQKNNRVTAWGR